MKGSCAFASQLSEECGLLLKYQPCGHELMNYEKREHKDAKCATSEDTCLY